MKALLFVFLGGGLGSLLRYLIGNLLAAQSAFFPWKTLVANIAGCFLLGIFTSFLPHHSISSDTKLLLTTGLCGGFTTFSTFSIESIQMLSAGNYIPFLAYVASSLVCGFGAAYLGMLIVK